MWPGKYWIEWAEYPFKGYYDGEYATDWLLPFLAALVRAVLRYPIVEAHVRDHGKMGM